MLAGGMLLNEEHMRATAASFLITGELIRTKIGSLSEGQKGLVAFARLVLERPGLLILDEPTNHINFRHIPIIAEAINKFDGAMILVSHAEDFVEKINLSKLITCHRCAGNGAEPGTKIKECFSCRGTGQVQQVKKTVFGSYTAIATCPECKGEGTIPEKPCNVCRGEGRTKGQETIEIHIPAGIDTNQVIRVDGKGEAGKKGGKAGNLFARIFIKQHPVFERRGDDLFCDIEINFSQAALGDEIEVRSLEGTNILLQVPAGTESGKVLRISGKGIPHFGGFGKGNLFIELIVKTPKKLSRRQKELLDELKKEGL